jgi:hypothetical protein
LGNQSPQLAWKTIASSSGRTRSQLATRGRRHKRKNADRQVRRSDRSRSYKSPGPLAPVGEALSRRRFKIDKMHRVRSSKNALPNVQSARDSGMRRRMPGLVSICIYRRQVLAGRLRAHLQKHTPLSLSRRAASINGQKSNFSIQASDRSILRRKRCGAKSRPMRR